ncbi:hypothetical protein FOA52_006459 [Chlamydomonas sp. UWO 241]|nr:hypothetical protein FOA52_006459 [Chlamydomonas sp. UWO 241]
MYGDARAPQVMHEHLSDEHVCWVHALSSFADAEAEGAHKRDAQQALEEVQANRVSARRALQLVTLTGCELCGRKAIRKVVWPFNIRFCENCIDLKTVTDYRLTGHKGDFHLKYSDLEGLRHFTTDVWHRHLGSFAQRHFWKGFCVQIRGSGVF